MNLIHDAWLTVRRKNGDRETIAPWQITQNPAGNPIVALDTPRADFNGALMQFLIGLVQTTCPPKTEEDWPDWLEEPPAPEPLKAAFAPVLEAFELDGDGPRFMQDVALTKGEEKSIGALLIEYPGEQTLKENKDHFIKRGGVEGMCPACAASALFTLQTNAPSGGAGHRTGLRGGGPLTTLVAGRTLWETVWLAVLPRNDFFTPAYGNPDLTALADRFPWMGATRTSEAQTGRETVPQDVHPAQIYWAMPRRIRLDFTQPKGTCDVCGGETQGLASSYTTQNYGVNYASNAPWRHPLTPYSGEPTALLPQHGQPGGLGYRHWMGLVLEEASDGAKPRIKQPGVVVSQFRATRQERWESLSDNPGNVRLWAFGYDMDNMKARCWYEGTLPLYQVKNDPEKAFELTVGAMVRAADSVKGNLRQAVRNAWFDKGATVKGDFSFVESMFWGSTEGQFYAHLAILSGDTSQLVRDKEKTEWHTFLCKTALNVFDQVALSGHFAEENPERLVWARKDLNSFNHGRRIRETLLNLPQKNQPK